jgi:hypothetical protein
MEQTKLKIIRRVSAQETLMQMEKGTTVVVKTAMIKPSSIRKAVMTLNKRGYKFEQTERGLVNEIKITRYR